MPGPPRHPEHRARVSTVGVLGIAGFALSLGLKPRVCGWLFAISPPMQGLRAAARPVPTGATGAGRRRPARSKAT